MRHIQIEKCTDQSHPLNT